jgi:hypothetical protein
MHEFLIVFLWKYPLDTVECLIVVASGPCSIRPLLLDMLRRISTEG